MTTQGVGPIVIRHHRIELALHRLPTAGEDQGRPPADAGLPLLCLHGLGESVASLPAAALARWPGPVWGLDFTGHGASTVPVGGGYTAELLMADADHALAHLGEAAVVGFGLGAYVALLLAGARPGAIGGAVLADGPGLAGGGLAPGDVRIVMPPPSAEPATGTTGQAPTTPDPHALAELAADVRPPDYARTYARSALDGGRAAPALLVAAVQRPPWLAAVVAEGAVEVAGLEAALARLSAASG